jgi:hypothetical protein
MGSLPEVQQSMMMMMVGGRSVMMMAQGVSRVWKRAREGKTNKLN